MCILNLQNLIVKECISSMGKESDLNMLLYKSIFDVVLTLEILNRIFYFSLKQSNQIILACFELIQNFKMRREGDYVYEFHLFKVDH